MTEDNITVLLFLAQVIAAIAACIIWLGCKYMNHRAEMARIRKADCKHRWVFMEHHLIKEMAYGQILKQNTQTAMCCSVCGTHKLVDYYIPVKSFTALAGV
jgi:hypothetical protein